VAALAGDGVVNEAHHAEDTLATDHALADADGLAGELDRFVGLSGASGLGDSRDRHDVPPFQVALTGNVGISVASE